MMGPITETDQDEMRLPDGRTCRQCVHFARCTFLIGVHPDSTVCDWHPSQFAEKLERPWNPDDYGYDEIPY